MGSRRWQRTWLIVAALCALGFVILAAIVNGQDFVAFDQPVTDIVQGLGIPLDVWLALTEAGGRVLIGIGIALVLALVALRRLPLAAIVGGALLVGTFGTEAVKLWVERPRPPDPLAPFVGYSFPSGHTFNSTVTYGLVALVAWRSSLSLPVRRVTLVALVALVASIGLSRIGLGVHYPSDVAAGWLGGMAIVATVAAIPSAVFFARWRRTSADGPPGSRVGHGADPPDRTEPPGQRPRP